MYAAKAIFDRASQQHPQPNSKITFKQTFKGDYYYAGLRYIMIETPTLRIRTKRKYYRLIFTGLMAMMMSLIISTALILVKVGFIDGFFMELLHSWGLAFVFAWPSAYICAYLIQEHLLSRIEFY